MTASGSPVLQDRDAVAFFEPDGGQRRGVQRRPAVGVLGVIGGHLGRGAGAQPGQIDGVRRRLVVGDPGRRDRARLVVQVRRRGRAVVLHEDAPAAVGADAVQQHDRPAPPGWIAAARRAGRPRRISWSSDQNLCATSAHAEIYRLPAGRRTDARRLISPSQLCVAADRGRLTGGDRPVAEAIELLPPGLAAAGLAEPDGLAGLPGTPHRVLAGRAARRRRAIWLTLTRRAVAPRLPSLASPRSAPISSPGTTSPG